MRFLSPSSLNSITELRNHLIEVVIENAKIIIKNNGIKHHYSNLSKINEMICTVCQPFNCHYNLVLFNADNIEGLMRVENGIIQKINHEDHRRDTFRYYEKNMEKDNKKYWIDSWKITRKLFKELYEVQKELIFLRALFPKEYNEEKNYYMERIHSNRGYKKYSLK